MQRPSRPVLTALITASVLGASTFEAAWADPFTLADDATVISLLATSWKIDRFLDGRGEERDLGPDVEQTAYIATLEHGLNDRITLSISLPWARSERQVKAGDDGRLATNDGWSDARVGAKISLAGDRPLRVALNLGLSWAGEYQANVLNSPGDGSFDQEVTLSLGHAFERGSLSLDTGYRFRSGEPADEILARLDGALFLGTRFQVFASLDYVNSEGGLGIDGSFGIFAPYAATEEDWTRLTLGGTVSFSEHVAAFAAVSRTLEGRSTALGEQLALGFSLTF